jgi:hypothetical protein
MSYDLCDVNQQLQYESGRIGEMVAAKVIAKDPWNRLVTQEEFPAGMGYALTTLIQERSVIPDTSNAAWSDIGPNDGTGSTCNPTEQLLQYARSTKSYNIQQAAVRSPGLCVNDLRVAWQAEQQLAGEYKILVENTGWFWSNRYRDEFIRLAGNKIVVDTTDTYTFSTSGSDEPIPASPAQYALDQGMLDAWYLDLNRDNAEGYYAMVDAMPQYALVCSPETSKYLQKQNADVRQDLRFSSEVDDLITPFGTRWAYSGFIHLIDNQAPRYEFVDGEYVRVPFYISVPASYGFKAIVNPAYKTAPYEGSIIYNTNVYTSRVLQTITRPGGNTSFDPVNYRGDFTWLNIRDNGCNKLGNQGYFFGIFAQGSEAKRTEWGYLVIHLRCSPSTLYQNCS